MDYTKITTDKLVEKIVAEIGTPLPTYDYEYNKYISVVPENLTVGNGAHGIEKPDMHETFRNACLRIILWNEGECE
jgi:hypothetical protein